MKSVMTLRQLQLLRRYLLIVSSELQTMATSEKLPDEWGNISLSSYTIAAQAAVYDLMAEDGLLPPRS